MDTSEQRETQASFGSCVMIQRLCLQELDLKRKKKNIRELTRGKLFGDKPWRILNLEIALLQVVLGSSLFFPCCYIPGVSRW